MIRDDGRLLIANQRALTLFTASEEESEGRRGAVRMNNMLLSSALSSKAIEETGAARRELLLVNPVANPINQAGGQQVRLFAGGSELLGSVVSADGITLNWQAADPVQLQTTLNAATAGGETLFLRAQVDGVDSSMLPPPAAGAPAPPRAFDPNLIVQVV